MIKLGKGLSWLRGGMVACLLVVSLTGASCEPLRKKFRREKKKDQASELIPVLEPIDYAPKMQSPDEQYRYHYSLWQIWQRDFLAGLEGNTSGTLTEKNQRYLLNQIIVQLEGMRNWLNDEKQVGLTPLIDDVYEVLKEYEKPAPMRSSGQIKRAVERCGRAVREAFKPELMTDYLRR